VQAAGRFHRAKTLDRKSEATGSGVRASKQRVGAAEFSDFERVVHTALCDQEIDVVAVEFDRARKE
jgi:hypothetical protein